MMSRVLRSSKSRSLPASIQSVKLLTVEDLSELTSFSKQTIWGWAREGKVPCYRIGNKYRFRADEINGWVEEHRQKRRVN